jgi:hypothetical protein
MTATIRDFTNNIRSAKDEHANACMRWSDAYATRSNHKLAVKDANAKTDNLLYYYSVQCVYFELVEKTLRNELSKSYYLTGSFVKQVKINKNKLKTIHPEICGICLEHHKYSNMITTSCNHHFGKKCFSEWIRMCVHNNHDVSCGMCRSFDFEMNQYISK